MIFCPTCKKDVEVEDNGGRNAKSLWCIKCGNRLR